MAKSAKDIKLMEAKDTIAQLNEVIRNQNELIRSLRESVDTCNATITNLNEQVAYLTQKLFGTSSEKRKDIDGQLSFIFNEAEQEASSEWRPEEEAVTEVKSHRRKAKRTMSDTFKGVPVIREVIELPEEQRFCPDCNAPLEKIGEELVRREFRYTPAKGEVVEIYTETHKCPECTGGSTPEKSYEFVKSEAPAPLIPHSYASASVVAWIMYQKYGLALPLYRQEKDWAQLGVVLLRGTMANWIIYCTGEYLLPLYEYFHREMLKREFLMADETRIQVLKEKDRSPETDSFMWLLRTGEDGLPPILIYRYTETRAGYNAREMLEGFHGYLMTDGYQGYNNLPGVTRCCCFAHIRRYFIEAVPKGKEYEYSNPAVQGVQFCNRLFEYERHCSDRRYTPEQRKEFRERKSRPVLEAFFQWLDSQRPNKGTRLEKAVNYAQNRKQHMDTYLEDGRCSFSNNLSENLIRPFTVGRKNWLFADSPKGADASAIVYTMVEMARAHDLNIYKYLTYLLEQRPHKDMTDEQLESLAPWSRKVIDRCSNKK